MFDILAENHQNHNPALIHCSQNNTTPHFEYSKKTFAEYSKAGSIPATHVEMLLLFPMLLYVPSHFVFKCHPWLLVSMYHLLYLSKFQCTVQKSMYDDVSIQWLQTHLHPTESHHLHHPITYTISNHLQPTNSTHLHHHSCSRE